MAEDIEQSFCDGCGSGTFRVYVAKNANLNGWFRVYCTNCGQELEKKRR